MPGLRWASFWEGDRAELFAQYVLSSIAAVVPVPRPVDFGFDFLCTLVHKKGGALYAGRSFGVQVKSGDSSVVKYGGLDTNGKWKSYEIEWLYGQSQPLLLCLADIKQLEIRLYSTSRMWWVRWTQNQPSEIVLTPDRYPSNILGDDPCSRAPIKGLKTEGNYGDGYSYQVPLGDPIARISLKEQESQEQCEKLRECLDCWIALEYGNISHYQTNIPYSEDVLKYRTNELPKARGSVTAIWHYTSRERDQHIDTVLLSIAPAIESLIRNLKVQGQEDKIKMIVPIARLARSYGAFFRSMVDSLLNKVEE